MSSLYNPRTSDLHSFGLWTLRNRGGDPFGDRVRGLLPLSDFAKILADVGARGINFHDDDLVPFGSTIGERDGIVGEFRTILGDHGLVVPMATVNLFFHPVFKDGAFTANNAAVRRFALQKTMRAMDLGHELGAKTFVLWGGREGSEVDAARDPVTALQRQRDAVDFLCEYSIAQGYHYKIALEAKPNEPRQHIYLPTTGAMLGFIATLAHSDMVGVNPEVAHETIPGLNFAHAVAQALDAGKLFHIDLNGQHAGRFDQDLRFGAADLKGTFYLVQLLEAHKYGGPLHFDAHPLRTEDMDGVRAFARACVRTHLIMREKVEQFNSDTRIQALLQEMLEADGADSPLIYSTEASSALLGEGFDLDLLSNQGRRCDELDMLLDELLLGVSHD
jgi:xylose isomerase